MNEETARKPKHVMTDWLELHELNVAKCQQILAMGNQLLVTADTNAGKLSELMTELDAAQAWQLSADALSAAFPDARHVIADVGEKTTKDLSDTGDTRQRPLTLNDAGDGYPYVRCGYRGRVSDLINVQHEFSHAVQIVVSKGTFLPPVLRECCAFIGELALLDYLRHEDADLFSDTEHRWQRQNTRISQKHRPVLNTALQNLDTPYNYNWNYPVARILSVQVCKQFTRKQKWRLFQSQINTSELLEMLNIH